MGWRHLAAPLVVATLFVPFLAKPFHIDDANFIALAKAIDLPFAESSEVELFHLGLHTAKVHPLASTHPPLIPLCIRLISWASGGYEEAALHTGFLLFPLLLLWAVGRLADRIGAPRGPALLVVGGSAAVLPVGQTLMADLPTAALFAGGAVALDCALDRRSALLGAAGGMLILMSVTASYQAAFFLPALLPLAPAEARAWLRGRRRALGLAAAAVAAVVAIVLAGVDAVPVPSANFTQGIRLAWLVNRLLSVPVLTGAALVFVLLATGVPRGLPRRATWAAATAGVVLAIGLGLASYPVLGTAILVLLGWTGVVCVLAVASRLAPLSGRQPVERFLAAWAALSLLLALLFLPFGAMRYLIPVVVPASLLLLAAARDRTRAWLAAVLTAGMGLAVAVADYRLAACYRDFALEVRSEIGSAATHRVWYAGDWGMKYYMAEQGFRYLTADSNEPRPGDLVVFATVARMWNPSPALGPRMELLDVREIRPLWPLVVMSQRERAGLYSTLWGLYPFVVGRLPIEEFAVYRVVG